MSAVTKHGPVLQAAAVFHIGMAKGGPPLPEGLSPECRDFLNLCFNRWHFPWFDPAR